VAIFAVMPAVALNSRTGWAGPGSRCSARSMLLMTGVAAALHYGVERPLAPVLKRLLDRAVPGRQVQALTK
jgi:hypothetical protein